MRLMMLVAVLLAPLAALAADPLPSWNAGEAKSSILAFVAEAANPASAGFVPEPQRVTDVAFDLRVRMAPLIEGRVGPESGLHADPVSACPSDGALSTP